MSCVGEPVHRLAGKGGAEAVDGHGGALRGLSSRTLPSVRKPSMASADLFGRRATTDAQLALLGQPPPQPAELAQMVRLQ